MTFINQPTEENTVSKEFRMSNLAPQVPNKIVNDNYYGNVPEKIDNSQLVEFYENPMNMSFATESNVVETPELVTNNQYLSMINNFIVYFLLFLYCIFRLGKIRRKKNPNIKIERSRIISLFSKLFFIISLVSTMSLLFLLIIVKSPLKEIEEKGRLIKNYEIKISKDLYALSEYITNKISDFVKLQKDTNKQNINTDEKLSLTHIINILYFLSHAFLTSSIILLCCISTYKNNTNKIGELVLFYDRNKKDKNTKKVKKNKSNGNFRIITILYALIRLPCAYLVDNLFIRDEMTSDGSIIFFRSLYYGFEGYFTVMLLILHVIFINESNRKTKIFFEEEAREHPGEMKNVKRWKRESTTIFMILLFSLAINTLLKYSLHILSLPIKINDLSFYVLNRVEDISGIIVFLCTVEGIMA